MKLKLFLLLFLTLSQACLTYAWAQDAMVAKVKILEKTHGIAKEYSLAPDIVRKHQTLSLLMRECRKSENGDIAFFEISVDSDKNMQEQIFSGWMFAKDPEISALEHPRYDVWLISCHEPDKQI